MRAIKSRDTSPELTVRRVLWNLGYRYRVSVRDLPGRPDIAFPAKRKVVFVHGCFWHKCPSCFERIKPKSNEDYWFQKLSRNVGRDREVEARLAREGWDVLTVFECETRQENRDDLVEKLAKYLGPTRTP